MGVCPSRCFGTEPLPTAKGLGLPKEFSVIRQLGRGNEGRTYLVLEKTHKRKRLFACKAIPRGNMLHPEFVLKGLRNQSSLCHTHVVKFLEVLLTKSFLIIKFEYMPGGDLFKYMADQSFINQTPFIDEEHARFLFIQILFAMHHCHRHRVAHRDLKFANILCTRGKNPIIKVCDFGLSKTWEHPEDATSFSGAGTLMFMAPQVRRLCMDPHSQPYNVCKSDVWGLGVILFRMLLGRYPFTNLAQAELHFREQLITGSTATFSFLLRRMEMTHRSDPQRLTKEINDSDISIPAKKLLLSMLATDENLRSSLEELIQHQWLRCGLRRERADAITQIPSEGDACKGSPSHTHAELIPGSPADLELERIVRRAAHVGSDNQSLVRWTPPGYRLRGNMTAQECLKMEREGIRPCSKCNGDTDEYYNALLDGIKIIPR